MKDPREEKYNPPKTLYVNASFTLMKNSVPIVTNNYDRFEDGSIDTSHTNWKEAYKEDHYTIIELLHRLEQYVNNDLKGVVDNITRKKLWSIKQDIQGWYVETEHFEEG